ncbi:MAG: hypothetical protein Q9180_006666, partial [Flavoplaca navasiana]
NGKHPVRRLFGSALTMHQTHQKTSLHNTLKPNFNELHSPALFRRRFIDETIIVTAYLGSVRHQLSSWHAAQNIKKIVAKGDYGREKREELMDSVRQWFLSYTEEELVVNQRDLISAQGPTKGAYLEENWFHKETLVKRYLENSENPRPALAEMPYNTNSFAVILSYELRERGCQTRLHYSTPDDLLMAALHQGDGLQAYGQISWDTRDDEFNGPIR